MEIGKIVKSKQGRDKGKVYVVYEIVDNDFVKLVNGWLAIETRDG